MISITIFFFLFMASLKEKYILSSLFKIGSFELFIFSVPIFSIVLVAIFSYNYFFKIEKRRKILILLIFLFFNMCIRSSNIYNFLFFIELCSFLITFLVLNLSKDYDKFSSIIFIFIFNILGSLPIFFIFFFSIDYESNSPFSNLISTRNFYFLFLILILIRKLPIFFFHFWLTKAHVRASGVCSIILAGVILKLGRFGLIKFSSLLIKTRMKFHINILRIRILRILFLRILIIRFFDLKYFVACSSIIHIALSFPSLLRGNLCGLLSRIFIIIAHGLVSFFLFFLVSLVYEFSHNRSFDFSKSLESYSKIISFLFFLFLFLNIGVPPFLNFYREIFSFSFLIKFSNFLTFLFFLSILLACLYLIFNLTKESFRKTEKFRSLENLSNIFPISIFFFSCYCIFFLFFYFFSLIKILFCGGREKKVIIFKKTFFFIFSLSTIFCLFFLNNYMELTIEISFFNLNFFTLFYDFSIKWEKITISFLLIVLLVVSLVNIYREFYLENYNNKKFLFVKLFFFFSIIILASSNNFTNLIIGWDWLGISSLFLIIFYPNKITLFNSYLTIIYNRLGDRILILILCLVPANSANFYFHSKNTEIILILLILCSFTKSAQFPLSTWLPAAISAPTPISAIVHSSTLVTAGLYLLSNLNFPISLLKFSSIFLYFRILSFLLGGLMAKVELDFKKIIAFSTLSQIRIIIYFFFLNFLILGLTHILIHAFFKTILFCCCGIFFIKNFSNQFFAKIRTNNNIARKIYWLTFLSVFSIRGLTFCRSFISKDKIIEFFIISTDPYGIILILGRILTLIYCRKILNIFKESYSNFSSTKKKFFFFFSLFRILRWILGKVIYFTRILILFPRCRRTELIFSTAVFLLIFNLEKLNLKFMFLKNLTLDISIIKSLTFRIWKNIFKILSYKFYNSDLFIFKPNYFGVLIKNKIFNKKERTFFLLTLLIWIFLFS